MIKLEDFLDATYLTTPEQENVSEEGYKDRIKKFLEEASLKKYKAVIVPPEYVKMARALLLHHKAKVLVGTVIDFPYGAGGIDRKMKEALCAMDDGADELDFVVDYRSFKEGRVTEVREEIRKCTGFCLMHQKTVKWIIEAAALTDVEIIKITVLIKNTVIKNFKEKDYAKVFVKSSTGRYEKGQNNETGATPHNLTLILENATPLSVKASGGIRNLEDVLFYIGKGVKRIGTSSQKELMKQYYGS